MPADPILIVDTVLAGPFALVTPAGEIDVDTAPDLRRALHRCLHHRSAELHVDLYAVRFCDCRGLDAFLSARRRARALDALVVLHEVPPIVAELLDVTGTRHLFTVL
ncbi:STAS domain-containing protein (plasmid) [Embleya sp. NBC_00888]|uniref:STAS domain-containing protein n=1 Tax=Embleya sp. NBC_00888 TaxID=2975960 RepID=UPI002F906CEF|nr:STAS domain-containing protein [Embleya sp. NBC_00888]